MSAEHILSPAADSLNKVRGPGKFTYPLMLRGLGAGPQSTAAKFIEDVMEALRNEGSPSPCPGQAATPGNLIRGDVTKK